MFYVCANYVFFRSTQSNTSLFKEIYFRRWLLSSLGSNTLYKSNVKLFCFRINESRTYGILAHFILLLDCPFLFKSLKASSFLRSAQNVSSSSSAVGLPIQDENSSLSLFLLLTHTHKHTHELLLLLPRAVCVSGEV